LSGACWLAGWLDSWEYASWGVRARAFAKTLPTSDQIKIILIDQASLDWAARENDLRWPWMRQAYAPIIDFCRRGGAKVIVFDILFTESSMYGVDDDELLAATISARPDFVGAFFTGDQAVQALHWPPDVPRPTWSVEGLDAWLTDARRKHLEDPAAAFPAPPIARACASLGTVRLAPDRDGVFRRIAPFRIFDGAPVPTLGLAAYLLSRGTNNAPPLAIREGALRIGDRSIPIDGNGRVVLRYRGPSGAHEAFAAAAVIQSELRMQEGASPTIDPEVFRDKYVFLGASAPGLKDLKPAPTDGDYPGVEIHATLLDNILARDALRDAPFAGVLMSIAVLSVAASVSIVAVSGSWKNAALFAVFLPIPLALGAFGYKAGYWWPIVAPTLGVGLALVGGVLWNYATEGRQKRFIKSAFKQYLGEAVIDQIIADPSKLRLGGERKELTMFFSDLEKFSSFSEKLEPPQLIELLNVYLTDMGRVLMEEGGYIDKYIGDAIVAFWNAPLAQPDHAARAIRAALRCRQVLMEKQAAYSTMAAGMPVRMRIGLNTGDVVIGNMGSQERFNYTMLGDAANLASRLEGANKTFGTYILAAESTWEAAGAAVWGRAIGAIRVVGRRQPVRVYEPMALRREDLPAWLRDYEEALRAVAERRWADARAGFEKIPGDPVSAAYARKLRGLGGADWDGVWELTEK
jgi:adenylate cyclase